MISIDIPGWRPLALEHLVLDYNGTLAVDGHLVQGVGERLERLSADLEVHVVTADTFGMARDGIGDQPCNLVVLGPGGQDVAKQRIVRELGAGATVAIGNGRNDALMLAEAALGIAVLLDEGAASITIQSADLICPRITAALDLLANPRRLVATLRS